MEPILPAWELAGQFFGLTMGFDDSSLHQKLNVCSGTFGQIRSNYQDVELPSMDELAAAERQKSRAKNQRANQKSFAALCERAESLSKQGIIGT